MREPILIKGFILNVPDRGTFIAGKPTKAWNTAKAGDAIELRSPDGSIHQTRIRDMMSLGTKMDASYGLPYKGYCILLANAFTEEDAPSDTEVWRVDDNAA